MRNSSPVIIVGSLLVYALLAPGQDWNHDWKLKRSRRDDQVHFTVERSKIGNQWSHSSDVPLDRFRGLSMETLERGGAAKFEYVHDAGRLLCQGRFSLGRGSGTYTFAPNPQFVSELQRLGYETPNEDQLLSMVMSDVGLEFARGVKDAGLEASTKQLIELRIHGVTLDYIHYARAAGYTGFSAKNFVEMRIHGVESDFLRDLKTQGYDLPARDIVELRIHGVTSELMADLRRAGYDLTSKQITELRIHGVTPEYLRELKGFGLQPSASDLVELRIHGVSPEFIRETKELGYTFTTKELTELKIHGVNGAYLKRLRDSGMRNLTAAQIAKLRIHGVY